MPYTANKARPFSERAKQLSYHGLRLALGVAALATYLGACAPSAKAPANNTIRQPGLSREVPTNWFGMNLTDGQYAVEPGQDPWTAVSNANYAKVVGDTQSGTTQVVLLGKVVCGATEFDNPILNEQKTSQGNVIAVAGLTQNVPQPGELGTFQAVLNDPSANCQYTAPDGSHLITKANERSVVLNVHSVHDGVFTDGTHANDIAEMLIGGRPADAMTAQQTDGSNAAAMVTQYNYLAGWINR